MVPAVLYEDNHLIAIHKPPGMLAQGDNTGDPSAVDWVTEYLRTTYNKPGNVYVGLLHRLDRPVGGVMLLAKTSKAAARLSAQFQTRAVQKSYLAVALNAPAEREGTLRHYIGPAPTDANIMRAYDQEGPDRKLAVLHYRHLHTTPDGLALLEVNPETGRKHQIRVQLARIGCGIVGDVKYSKTDFLPDHSVALHAHTLRFTHPTTQAPVVITAPPPRTWPWTDFPNA